MQSKRTVIVTGAAKGIGKAIVERFIKDNYKVIAIDIDTENGKKLESEFSPENLEFYKVDISNEADVKAFYTDLLSKKQSIDVLVNNAGIIRDNMIWNMESEDFDLVMNINLRGVWLMCREAAKLMRNQKSGRIVNIASRAWLGNRGQSNYSASKAGVVGLTRVLALELGKYNVLVNAIAPGLIDTPLTQKLTPETLQKLIETQPTKTMGSPEDVANAVSFLSAETTQFITGQTLYVDGGKSIGAGI